MTAFPGMDADLALYGRARRGDAHAARALVRRHSPAVLHSIHSSDLLGLSDDALQEAWIRVLRPSPSDGYTGRGSFSSWLILITWRVLVRMHKGENREHEVQGHAQRRRTATRASRRVLFDEVVEAIHCLPNPDHREVARLHWLAELSSYEIGKRLNVSPKTIQSRILAAHRQLVGMLNLGAASSIA